MSTHTPRQVDSARKTCRIISLLQTRESVGVTELATELGISKSTVHGHLATLLEEELVVKENHQYRLGLKFVGLSESVKESVADPNIVRTEVRNLAAETGEVVHFGAEENGHVVYLEKDRGDGAVQTVSSIGDRMPMHSTSLGKAILAERTHKEVDQLIQAHGLPERTANTITELSDLYAELEDTAARGYAIDNQENIPGVRCIGVTVDVPGTDATGALSISGPSRRMTDARIADELQEILTQTANVIEVNSLYS